MPGYFSFLPNIYIANGAEQDEPISYTLVKNIFKRLSVDSDLNQNYVAFEKARIEDGDTPDSIALEYYGDPFLDWVVLLTNNIVDKNEQWPKDEVNFLDFVIKKYDGDTGGVHHWETIEVEYEGETFIPEGLEVNESFRATLPNGTVLSLSLIHI